MSLFPLSSPPPPLTLPPTRAPAFLLLQFKGCIMYSGLKDLEYILIPELVQGARSCPSVELRILYQPSLLCRLCESSCSPWLSPSRSRSIRACGPAGGAEHSATTPTRPGAADRLQADPILFSRSSRTGGVGSSGLLVFVCRSSLCAFMKRRLIGDNWKRLFPLNEFVYINLPIIYTPKLF